MKLIDLKKNPTCISCNEVQQVAVLRCDAVNVTLTLPQINILALVHLHSHNAALVSCCVNLSVTVNSDRTWA